MDIEALTKELLAHGERLAEADALRESALTLPGCPPGFASGPRDRIEWTARWVREHWDDAGALRKAVQERDAEKRRADLAEAREHELQATLASIRAMLPNARLQRPGAAGENNGH